MKTLLRRASFSIKKTFESQEKSYHQRNVDYVMSRIYNTANKRNRSTKNARLLLLSDIHYTSTSKNIINAIPSVVDLYIKNKLNIDCAVLLGDYWGNAGVSRSSIIHWDESSQKYIGLMPKLKEDLEPLYKSIPTLVCLGNHDKNRFSTNAASEVLTNDEVYDLFTEDFVKNCPKLHRDPNNLKQHYWYYDIPKSKIRVICMNMYDSNDAEQYRIARYIGQPRYSVELLNWLVNDALIFNESGWGVILCLHDTCMGTSTTTVKLNDGSNFKYIAYNNGTFEYMKLLDKFMSAKSGSISYSDICGSGAGQINYDFSKNHGSNEIICSFGGHLHSDVYSIAWAKSKEIRRKYSNGENATTVTLKSGSSLTYEKYIFLNTVLSIRVNSTSPLYANRGEGYAHVEANLADFYSGGFAEVIFSLVEIDRVNKKIYCDRFGGMYSMVYKYGTSPACLSILVTGTIKNEQGSAVSGAEVYLKFNNLRRYPHLYTKGSPVSDKENGTNETQVYINKLEIGTIVSGGKSYANNAAYFYLSLFSYLKHADGSDDIVQNHSVYKVNKTENNQSVGYTYTTQLSTPSDGTFVIYNVPPDKCTLVVKAEGYKTKEVSLDLTNTATTYNTAKNLGNITLTQL